jgi:hypothetical protein
MAIRFSLIFPSISFGTLLVLMVYNLPCAVPARIINISVLIWRHPLLGNTAFELHTAARDTEAVRAKVFVVLSKWLE